MELWQEIFKNSTLPTMLLTRGPKSEFFPIKNCSLNFATYFLKTIWGLLLSYIYIITILCRYMTVHRNRESQSGDFLLLEDRRIKKCDIEKKIRWNKKKKGRFTSILNAFFSGKRAPCCICRLSVRSVLENLGAHSYASFF